MTSGDGDFYINRKDYLLEYQVDAILVKEIDYKYNISKKEDWLTSMHDSADEQTVFHLDD